MPTILSTPMLACFRGERAWFHRCEITKQHGGGGTSLPALSRANPAAAGPHCDEEPSADVNFYLFGQRHGLAARQPHSKDDTMAFGTRS